MLGLCRILSTNLVFKNAGHFRGKTGPLGTRSAFKLDFDSSEEIVENYFDNIMLIGINLTDNKNVLTKTAIVRLKDSFSNFEIKDEYSSAIICGFGGTFCTGVANEDATLKESQKLIEILSKSKKPIIAAINGCAINFGFHLATMCDMRVMEDESMAGFGSINQRSYVPDLVYQRLALSIGITRATEIVLAQSTRTAKYWSDVGFSVHTSCGSALGQAMRMATSLGQKPLKEIIEEKSKILSVSPKLIL